MLFTEGSLCLCQPGVGNTSKPRTLPPPSPPPASTNAIDCMGRRLGTRFSFRWNNKVASWITVREPLNPKRGPSTQETFTRPHTPTMYAAAAPSFRASRRARPPPRPPPPAASSRAAPLIKSVAAPPRPPRRFHPAAPPRAAGRPRRTTNWPSGRPSRAAARRCGCQLHWRCRLLLLLHGLLHVAHADNRDRVGAPIVFAPTQHARARAPSIRAARAQHPSWGSSACTDGPNTGVRAHLLRSASASRRGPRGARRSMAFGDNRTDRSSTRAASAGRSLR